MKKLMSGSEAAARGAYEASVGVVSSYPGMLSPEIMKQIVLYKNIYAEWAPNEKSACETALGASAAGARSMTCADFAGLNVMAAPIFASSCIGVNGGMVICVADVPVPRLPQGFQDLRYYARAARLAMLEPSDSQECRDFMIAAYELSENYGLPVFVRLTSRVLTSKSLVEIGRPKNIQLKEYKKNFYMSDIETYAVKRHYDIFKERLSALEEYAQTAPLNKVEFNSGKIGIITSGVCYWHAKEALGDSASYLKLGMVYPLPIQLIRNFADNVEKVYVLEELAPFIEENCREAGINVIGKEQFNISGEYTPEVIRLIINRQFLAVKEEGADNIPERSPDLCPGCPYRGIFYVIKKLGLIVSGDIGCYMLSGGVDTLFCEGAAISAVHGMIKARGEEFGKNIVSVIGDTAFLHSGIAALIDVVYNKGADTVIILDNSTAGLAGCQDNSASGYTIRREPTKQVNIAALCRAIGVEHIRTVDPFDLHETEAALKEETERAEPSVIIADSPCALLKTAKYNGRCRVNERCIECGACLKLKCPAIHADRVSVSIDEAQCVGCGLCESICLWDAIDRLK